MVLIVGLGNPEKKYETTFHNMGFLAVGEAADKLGVKFKKKECEASVAEAFAGGEKVILARPVTYMNASGRTILICRRENFGSARAAVRVRTTGCGAS